MNDRQRAINILTQLTLEGCTEEEILNVILNDFLSGPQSLEAMQFAAAEFDIDIED